MNKFNIGDLITGRQGSEIYLNTKEGWIGTVLSVEGDAITAVTQGYLLTFKGVKVDIGCIFNNLRGDFFVKYDGFVSTLTEQVPKKFDIGDLVTHRGITGVGDYGTTEVGWVGKVIGVSEFRFEAKTLYFLSTHKGCKGDIGISYFLRYEDFKKYEGAEFLVGDLVTGSSTNTLGTITRDFVGEITGVFPGDSVTVRVIKDFTGGKDSGGFHQNIPISNTNFVLYKGEDPRKSFRVGQMITALPASTYSITRGNFVGKVVRNNNGILSIEVIRTANGEIPSNSEKGPHSGCWAKYFKLYEGTIEEEVKKSEVKKAVPTKSRSKTTSMKKESSEPQFFMEGVDVRIAKRNSMFYDVLTEDYQDQVVNIKTYMCYKSEDNCWLMLVETPDGEMLEVLESEIQGYKSKSVATCGVGGDFKISRAEEWRYTMGIDPAYIPITASILKHTYNPAISSIDSFKIDIRGAIKPALDFRLQPFDITPKKRELPKLVF